MKRSEIRARQRGLAHENMDYPADAFVEIPRERWPAVPHPTIPLKGVYRSRHFFVQAYDEPGGVVRLSVCRTALTGAGDWLGDITWEEMQWVKDTVGYAAFDAVEVYPSTLDVVNVANMRHLWVLPESLPFAWRTA
jgi:hypothetical protein